MTDKIDYTSILPSNNFQTHTSQERERESYSHQAHAKKEGEGIVDEALNQPRPTAQPSCLKLVIAVAWSSSSPPLYGSSPPPLDLVAVASRSTPLDRISISFSIYLSLSLSLSLFLPPSLSFTEFESLTIGFILIFFS